MLMIVLLVLLVCALAGGGLGLGLGWGLMGWSPLGVILLVLVVLWLSGRLNR